MHYFEPGKRYKTRDGHVADVVYAYRENLVGHIYPSDHSEMAVFRWFADGVVMNEARELDLVYDEESCEKKMISDRIDLGKPG